MFFRRNKHAIRCPASVLFQILSQDQAAGLCTHILFETAGNRHQFGAWGDAGKTEKNVVFYFDKQEYFSAEELAASACLGSSRLAQYPELILITECNGCHPDSLPELQKYTKQAQ